MAYKAQNQIASVMIRGLGTACKYDIGPAGADRCAEAGRIARESGRDRNPVRPESAWNLSGVRMVQSSLAGLGRLLASRAIKSGQPIQLADSC